ncbi:MAG TPA: helix-turn-helix transcriptional regulator [Candidatus Limnocylindria bacterium]|nr:helix-turn-helix transcriptional regulator [Candidatus Limnocylindria bacterium]
MTPSHQTVTAPTEAETSPSPPTAPEEALARFGRAFAHPMRIRIVLALVDGAESSPRDLALTLGEPLSNVSYHVRALADLGAIELRRMLPRRGALQHFYALAPALRLMVPLAQQLSTTGAKPQGDVTVPAIAAP